MRYLERHALPDKVQRRLLDWSAALAALPDDAQKVQADRTWGRRSITKTMQRTRVTLRQMNGNRDRCMYCEYSIARQIDHFEPRERAPARTYDWPNMLMACDHCNGNKAARFIGDDGETPVDPTVDDPAEHLELSPIDGSLAGVTPRGAWTVEIFGLNRSATLRETRRHAWRTLQDLIVLYHESTMRNDSVESDEIRERICGHPFPGVLDQLIRIARDPNPGTVIGPACMTALRLHSEIATWPYSTSKSAV